MKKKILAALVCAALALNLTACSENNEKLQDSSSTTSSSSTVSESKPEESSSKPEKSSSKPEESSSKPEESSSKPEESSSKPEESSSKPEESSSKPEESSSKPEESSSKPEESSSKPEQSSSKPTTSTNPQVLNWDDVPVAKEEDFEYDIVGDLKNSAAVIRKYIGTNPYVKVPNELGGEKVIRVHNETNWGKNTIAIMLSDACTMTGFKYSKFTGGLAEPTGIGKGENVIEIVFPDSWTTIGAAGLKKLEKINIPKNLNTIVKWGFEGSKLSQITFPQSLQVIGEHAFKDCTDLTAVNFPKSLASEKCTIQTGAFSGCTKLKTVELPKGVSFEISTDHYTHVFEKCTSLEKVTLPEGMKVLWDRFFSGCTSLKEVNLPDGLTRIEPYAFENCTSLKSLTIPDSATNIHPYFMKGCSGFTITYLGQTFNDKNYVKICGSLY